jgi:hypothetical protein
MLDAAHGFTFRNACTTCAQNKCLYVNTINSTSQNFYSLSSIVWTLKSTEYRGMGREKLDRQKINTEFLWRNLLGKS